MAVMKSGALIVDQSLLKKFRQPLWPLPGRKRCVYIHIVHVTLKKEKINQMYHLILFILPKYLRLFYLKNNMLIVKK